MYFAVNLINATDFPGKICYRPLDKNCSVKCKKYLIGKEYGNEISEFLSM